MLNSRWKKKEGKSQGDVETIGWAGGEVGEGQATLAFPGKALVCGSARQGLREKPIIFTLQ